MHFDACIPLKTNELIERFSYHTTFGSMGSDSVHLQTPIKHGNEKYVVFDIWILDSSESFGGNSRFLLGTYEIIRKENH